MEETKKKTKWGPIIGIAVGVGVMTGITNLNRTNPYNKLVGVSEEINEKGAVKIDNDTRLDSTSVIKEPLTLVYYYTVVSVNKDSLAVDLNDTKEVLRKQTQEGLDTSPEMEDFRKHDVSLKYTYKDKKARFLFDFTIKPKNVQ